MTILWIISGVVAWYGVGLLGSAIGHGAIKRSIEHEFGSYNLEEGDTKFGLLMALLGVFNVLTASVMSLIWCKNIKPEWYWLKK